jgi:hypothetical protein
MESSFDLDGNEGESMYDLRMIERETFGKMYNALLESRVESMRNGHSGEDEFRSIAVAMAQYLRHYMTEEEMVELAKDTEVKAERDNGYMTWQPDRVHDAIERLRHAAGLKLPQESNPDPESVGAEQL